MEDAKESDQRPSVSMPSLDAVDYFPSQTESSESELINTEESFVSATIITDQDISDKVDSSENSLLIAPTASCLNGENEITNVISNDSNVPSGTDLLTNSVDPSGTFVDALDESQSEEDPSIAIDQFIKKIADEQLSSKRIEDRVDEDTTENQQSDASLETNKDPDAVSKEKNMKSADQTDEAEKTEEQSMDIDVKPEIEATLKIGYLDAAESIEEIQKEIDKIPQKKNESSGKMDTDCAEDVIDVDEEDEGKSKLNILKSALEKQDTFTIEDSSDVAKDATLIEKAQEEIKKMDVFVCGECHISFHYIQEFTEHKKPGNCTQSSLINNNGETESKPQVWGFILWKTKQVKDLTDNIPSPWNIFQKWCKLSQSEQNVWITAGQSIQFASKIGNAKISEVKSSAKQTTVQKIMESSSDLADCNKENSSILDADNIIKKGITKPIRLNNDVTILPSIKKDEFIVEKIMAKRFNPRRKTWEYNIKWENFEHDSNTWEPINNLAHCKTLLDQFEEQLKRMKEEKAKQVQSPKARGRPANPKTVKPNTTNFVPIAPKTVTTISTVVAGRNEEFVSSGRRPQRSSKQKAMNQVKQWCGNISDDGNGLGIKRKYDTDDSDEDYDDKKIKLEEESDDSNKEAKTKIRKVTTIKSQSKDISLKNGNSQILPSNILIPDANGVVKINQKQLPSLSSGVYIMSKTAGIIKLDSTTSKVATSGGQTILKVAPKIGQTQIKIVKKDGNTTRQIIQVSPSTAVTSTPMKISTSSANNKPSSLQKVTTKIRREIKKTPISEGAKSVTKKLDTSQKDHEGKSDSDDGLEPLPFPGPDDPIPELEHEQKSEEFMLDPETGKVAGVEYDDKPVIIKTEPAALPPTTNELENIVKIAAAELSDEDLHTSDSQDDSIFTDRKDTKFGSKLQSGSATTSTPMLRKIIKYTVAGGQSIKSEKIVGPAQRQLVSSGTSRANTSQVQQRKIVQQKVINHMVSQKAPAQQTRTVVRHVIESSKPGQAQGNFIRKNVQTVPKTKYNTVAQKAIPSPLQPTRTYSALGSLRQSNVGSAAGPGSKVQVFSTKTSSQSASNQQGVRRIGNTVVRPSSSGQVINKAAPTQKQPATRIVQRVPSGGTKSATSSPKKPTVSASSANVCQAKTPVSSKPKSVISMPSLTEDDSPTPSSAKQKVQKAQPNKSSNTNIKADSPSAVKETVTDNSEAVAETDQTDWSSFTMADSDNPIYVTGDDGTIYQVAGQNEQGQTILITQGPDGQQQCLLVTNEISEMTGEDNNQTAQVAEDELINKGALMESVEVPTTIAATSLDESSLQTPLQINTDQSGLEVLEGDGDVQDQVVAQVVRAEPPSPGGTHKVVVMLPDGNLMVTQVSPEEYASLELE